MVPIKESDVLPDTLVAGPSEAREPHGDAERAALRLEEAALREAILRREVAKLTADRRRLINQLDSRPEPLPVPPPAPVPAPQDTIAHLELLARIEQLEASLAAKDGLIRALYTSTSWRLMAPVRLLAGWLRNGKAPSVEEALAATNLPPVALKALPPPSLPAEPEIIPSAEELPLEDVLPPVALAAKSEGSLGEIIIVSDHLPLFDRQSGGLRLRTLIGLVANLGWTVTFCSYLPQGCPDALESDAARERYEQALLQFGVSRITYGLDGMREVMRSLGENLRLAFVSFPIVATEVIPIIRTHCPWARVIFDTVDLHFVRVGREAALKDSPGLRREAEELRELEFSCIRMADVTVTVSEDERRLLLDYLPDVVVETLPNIFVQPPREAPGPEYRRNLMFLGGFQHQPNIDAVVWFVSAILPLIRQQAPDVIFRVVGSNPPKEVDALGDRPGVEIVGYVEDLQPYFDAARVFVAPLRYGAGMKGKVGQAMINGLPVVSTPVGAEGMGAEDGVHLLVADDVAAFAEHVLSLLKDDALWRVLQTEGHSLIEGTLSERAVSEKVARLFHV